MGFSLSCRFFHIDHGVYFQAITLNKKLRSAGE
jgi:hypothetical protein